MNEHDLDKLLREADAPPPTAWDAVMLTQTVRRRAGRARIRHVGVGAGLLALIVAGAFTLLPHSRRPALDIAAIEREIRALEAAADLHDATARAIAQRTDVPGQPSADVWASSTESQVEYAAAVLLVLAEEARSAEETRQRYAQIVEYFPATRSATVARRRLNEPHHSS